FFFQAEDGIRDFHVTGVQTCALPICGTFRTPYINARYIFPAMLIVGLILSFTVNREKTLQFVNNTPQISEPTTLVTSFSLDESRKVSDYLYDKSLQTDKTAFDTEEFLSEIYSSDQVEYEQLVVDLPISDVKKYTTGFALFQHKIPMWLFIIGLIGLTVWAYRKNLSLIPLLGLTCCIYMMAELT